MIRPLAFDVAAAKAFCVPDSDACSQFYQAGMLFQLFEQIGRRTRYFVEFGARRPRVLNSAYFRIKEDWRGLLLDGAPLGDCANCTGGAQPDARILLEADDKAPVRLRQAFLSMDNINRIFADYNVPADFDLLTIDVDKNDVWLLQALDTARFSPRVICIEFSSYFTAAESCVPPYRPENVWDGYHVTNSSLRAVDEVMRSKGYTYVDHVAGEHAIYARSLELHALDVGREIPWEVPFGWQFLARKIGIRFKPTDFECKISQSAETVVGAEPQRSHYCKAPSGLCAPAGDFCQALGHGEASFAQLQHALGIAQQLAGAEPTRLELQRDLSVTYERMGDLCHARGRCEEAREAFSKAMEIAESLAGAEPKRVDLQWEWVVSLSRMANLARGGGADYLERALDVLRRLDGKDLCPHQTDWVEHFEDRLRRARVA